MNNHFRVVDAINNAVAALPFQAKIYSLSVSLRASGAIVTVERARGDKAAKGRANRRGRFASYEWAHVNPSQLYWGHYDMTETEAATDHAQRFARLTGGALS